MWTGSYTPALVHCMPCESFEYNTNSLAYGSPNYTRHQRGRTLPTMFPLSCALAHAHTTFRLACTAFSYWRTIGIGHECYCSRSRPNIALQLLFIYIFLRQYNIRPLDLFNCLFET